jgi:hypothetical protein
VIAAARAHVPSDFVATQVSLVRLVVEPSSNGAGAPAGIALSELLTQAAIMDALCRARAGHKQ